MAEKHSLPDWTDIKTQIITILIGAAVTGLVTNVIFIWNINETISIIREDYKEIKGDVRELERYILYTPKQQN